MGDEPHKLKTAVYRDASFAGDLRDSKSTSVGLVCLVGPRTFVPLSWICKNQRAVSHSSTDAEIISLTFGLKDKPSTPTQVGQRFGISKERVRQLRNRALKKLKQTLLGEERVPSIYF